MPKNYTVKETAIIFRRSDYTIRRWIAERYIVEVIKVRDGYLIPENEIKRLLEGDTNNNI